MEEKNNEIVQSKEAETANPIVRLILWQAGMIIVTTFLFFSFFRGGFIVFPVFVIPMVVALIMFVFSVLRNEPPGEIASLAALTALFAVFAVYYNGPPASIVIPIILSLLSFIGMASIAIKYGLNSFPDNKWQDILQCLLVLIIAIGGCIIGFLAIAFVPLL